MEILKQPQYTPFPVEKQTAIIYCGVKGLLLDVPVERIRDFEDAFLLHLEKNHNNVLETIKQGKLTDEVIDVLEKEAKDMVVRYKKS